MHCFMPLLVLQSSWRGELVALLLLSKNFVPLLRGAEGWSAVCDCGIS